MIQRESYMKRIRPFINKELVKVLTGIRRSGKSVMLELIKQELRQMGVAEGQILSYNFESMDNARLCTAEALYKEILTKAPQGERVYLFFDEIQEVQHWEKAINSFRVDLDCDIYITGSNSHLLSGELATYLAGRYVEFIIYPFSLSEFMLMYQTVYPGTSKENVFRQYLKYGGMPYLGALHYDEDACRQYLQDLYNAVELKDVIRRGKIRDVDLLERVFAFILVNIGNPFSSSSLVKFLKSEGRKTSVETVLNYLHAGEEAYLFYPVRRENLAGKNILLNPDKYYVADHSVRRAILGNNMNDIQQVLENIVYVELLRRNYRVTVGKYNDKEIDFVAYQNGEKIYIQVTYLLASPETIKREFGIYQYVHDNYPKYVVSLDEFNMSQNGVQHWNLRDFLLAEHW